MIENRWLSFILLSSILFLVGYVWPYRRSIKVTRKGMYQDIFIWVMLVDFYFYPFLEATLEKQVDQSYREIFSILIQPNLMDRISINSMALPIQFLIIFCVMEFINYAVHRFIKHHNFGWQFHKTHHSSKEMDQFSDARNHPFLILFETFLFAVPALIILNPNVSALAIYGTIGLIWGPLIHHNIDLKWPFPISHILSSPHTHRWHHARDRGVHCNFAGIFIFYDVIFGSFYSPKESCSNLGFEGDDDFPQSFVGMLFYPFKHLYNRINLKRNILRNEK